MYDDLNCRMDSTLRLARRSASTRTELGHKRLETTTRYTRVRGDLIAAMPDLLDQLKQPRS